MKEGNLSEYRFTLSMILMLIITAAIPAAAQSPEVELWRSFTEWNPGRGVLPEDMTMGVLADRRNPDPGWSEALLVCDRVFAALGDGVLPADEFHPALKIPLTRSFEKVLTGGGRNLDVRYGLPVRTGNRIAVGIRADDGQAAGFGHVYLVLYAGTWYVEQWALDLTVYQPSEKPVE
jgi:hypothetical protein